MLNIFILSLDPLKGWEGERSSARSLYNERYIFNPRQDVLSKMAVFSAGISFFTKQANESVLTSVDDKINVLNNFPLSNHHIWALESPVLDIMSPCV